MHDQTSMLVETQITNLYQDDERPDSDRSENVEKWLNDGRPDSDRGENVKELLNSIRK